MKKIRIGLDAKWYFHGPPSGRVVSKNNIDDLIRNFPEYEFFVILRKEDKDKNFEHKKENVKLVYTKCSSNNLLWNIFISPFQLKKYNLDIVLFQNFSPFFSSFKRIAFIYDVIFRSHPEYFSLKERLYFFPLKFVSRFAHGIITISQNEKQRLIKFGYSTTEKIDVAYLGISQLFKPADTYPDELKNSIKIKYGLPGKFLLYVGRINIRKNIASLVLAMKHLKNDISLLIVGKKDHKAQDLLTIAKKEGLGNRIIFTGFVSDEDLYIIYSLATIFIFVSLEEGFGLPPLEAMASGIPVVVSQISCIPEVCGEAATYVDPYEPKSIAEKIDFLLDNSAEYNLKKESGIKHSTGFNWMISANIINNMIRKLV